MPKSWAKAYSKTGLCMVWEKEHLPMPAPADVTTLYETRFRPALERDAARLHDAFVVSHRAKPMFKFADYVSCLSTLRESMADLDVNPAGADTDFAALHDDIIKSGLRGSSLYTKGRTIFHDWRRKSGKPAATVDDDYRDRRYESIAANTGPAIRVLSERYANPADLARLYAESQLGGPDATRNVVAGQWLDERKNHDLDYLKYEMFLVRAEQAVSARAAAISADTTPRLTPAQRDQVTVLYEIRGGVRVLTAA